MAEATHRTEDAAMRIHMMIAEVAGISHVCAWGQNMMVGFSLLQRGRLKPTIIQNTCL
jgi:hypothetical protein